MRFTKAPAAAGSHQRASRASRRSLRLVTRLLLLGGLSVVVIMLLRRPHSHLELEDALPPKCAALRTRFAPLSGEPARAWASRSALYSGIASKFRTSFTGVSGKGGTQGMSVEMLFSWDDAGMPQPKLQRLEVPVRAIVLPLSQRFRATADALADAVEAALLPLLGRDGVWLQDRAAMHSSLFHASHHLVELPATPQEVDAEAASVAAVFAATCPIRAVLERILVTPGGVVIACWNVVSGGQPSAVRRMLRAALPRAPQHQLVSEPHILHSTLARILRPPADGAAALEPLAEALSAAHCGTEVVFDEVWYVEEYDALALALQGAYKERALPLSCAGGASGGRAMDEERNG